MFRCASATLGVTATLELTVTGLVGRERSRVEWSFKSSQTKCVKIRSRRVESSSIGGGFALFDSLTVSAVCVVTM